VVARRPRQCAAVILRLIGHDCERGSAVFLASSLPSSPTSPDGAARENDWRCRGCPGDDETPLGDRSGGTILNWGYGKLATEVYELDKPIGRSFGDVEYYAHQLAGITGPILEPATGTGRILIPLLEKGLHVEGVDSSPDMLAVCRQHCQDRGLSPVLREADMTTFIQPGAYQAVIIPTGSIALLDGRAAQQALAAFRESLAPGGRLIVDLPAPRLITEPEPMRYWWRDPYLWTLQTMHIDYDPVASQTTRFLRYEKWHSGGLVATELQLFRLQHWSPSEFRHLLTSAGFTSITVTADYQDNQPPEPSSNDWTFHAVRR
jgi:SAM-dependent methyltransferase